MGHLCRWLVCLAICDGCATHAWAKVVMGIASGEDYHLVSPFCFVFPQGVLGVPTPNGHIHSQTIVSSPGHKFLVVNRTEVERGVTCEELVKQAKVIEPLTERSTEVIAYDLTLNVDPSMNLRNFAAVIARCGEPVSAEYIVEFTNPGGYLENQFACSDQGLLQRYILLAVLVALGTPAFLFACRLLQRRQAHNDVSAIFFTSAAFYGTRVCFFLIHLLVYARNGMGLGMLLFVAQFLDFLSTSMLVVVLVSLVHGVYVTRPSVPNGSEERDTLMRVTGSFVVLYLLSTLACGFRFDSELTPFGLLRSPASWPYLIARSAIGFFCFKKGLAVSAEAECHPAEKKNIVLKFALLSLVWLESMPAVMLFSNEDSWHHDLLMTEGANFCVFGVLLYFVWPSRFGSTFSCIKATERMHPYSEFGLAD